MIGKRIAQGRTAEIFEYGDGRVLKLFRAGWSLEAVEYEARVARAVNEAGLDAPRYYATVQHDGRGGIVYERLDGISMLDELARKPWTILRAARQFADLHLAMHAVPRDDPPPQRAQLTRMITRAAQLDDATKQRALARLAELPDRRALCHGDFHPDNILMTARGPVVIDWASVTRGNPLADVARTSLLARVAVAPPEFPRSKRLALLFGRRLFHAAYLRRYFEKTRGDPAEFRAWVGINAAARLSEGIVEEYAACVRLAQEFLKE